MSQTGLEATSRLRHHWVLEPMSLQAAGPVNTGAAGGREVNVPPEVYTGGTCDKGGGPWFS